MFIALFKLDIYHAFRCNPLIFIYLVLLIIYIVIDTFTNKLNKLINNKKFLITVLFITILYGILRNLEIFSFLQPIS